jgi:DNA primase
MGQSNGVVFTDDLEAAKDLCKDFGLTYDEYKPNVDYQNYISVYKRIAQVYNMLLKSSSCPNPDYFKARGLDSLEDEYLLGYCPAVLIDKNNTVVSFKALVKEAFPNIDEATLDSYGLYDSRGDSIMAGRYVFTIFDSKGNPVAFSGRSVDPDTPAKYLNTPETMFFRKRFTLYNYHVAKKFGTVYVVEGYCDALSLISMGFKNVVAAMGTSFTQDHISLLKEKNIILSLDNDNAGQQQTYNLIMNNKSRMFDVLLWSGAKDLNEFLLLDMMDFTDTFMSPKIISGAEFVIQYLKTTLDLSTLQGRNSMWISLATLIGARDRRYQPKYPINTLYTPVAIDYYWTIVSRIIKGKRGN